MPLEAGKVLGPYEILSPIGAGGMGEVYKARDTRLERIVAIKVLPEHVAADPDLKQRFEREARTVAALNHPHICTLHDIGSQDGIDFLVMEYLDGETVAHQPEDSQDVVRYTMSGVEVSPLRSVSDFDVSADGRWLVYRGLQPNGNGTQFYVRRFDQLEAIPLVGTENWTFAFFSPDGESVGFQGDAGNLERTSVFGGVPERIVRLETLILGARAFFEKL